MSGRFFKHIYAGIACTTVLAVAVPADAQRVGEWRYDLPAQPLGTSLRAVAGASGTNIIVSSTLVDGKLAPALSGRFTDIEAISALLKGSGLRARATGSQIVVERDDQQNASDADDSDIVVTGTRIRGAPVASPVITRTAETIRNEGQATLADVIRTIPQNFGGGQNPGIGINVPAASGVNVGGGSSLNLRGLGSDATLTLLNGRRLAYSASRQSVDVSAIPVNAVERIEIVADGASAIYGSDAVAGVANIRLRRDAEGLLTSARLGGSTDGGNFEQIYGAVTGGRWEGGGLIVAYEYGRNTAIRAEDRDYARDRTPGLDLFPYLRRHSAVLSGHQRLAPQLEATVDVLFNHRDTFTQYAILPGGDLSVRRGEQPGRSTTLAIAPTLRWTPGAWRVEATGSIGRDRVNYESNQFTGSQRTSRAFGCYCNQAQNIELAGDGPVFDLPGGRARLALGIGYRNNRLESLRGDNATQNIDASQDSVYGYGEASLPIVGPAQRLAGIYRLNLSAALRYERYPGIDEVVTPKFGLIYAPTPDFEVKGSWGKSFRAPTLFQRYQPLIVAVFPARTFGATGAAAGATAFYLSGGRAALRPERAESWSGTLVLHPRALSGVTLEVSYFETRYRDRIVSPITFIARALSDPIYASQIVANPSVATLDALRAGAGQFLNVTGQPYDPARVVAVIDNANVNAGRQRIRGIDALLNAGIDLGGGRLTGSVNASYLESDQQLTMAQPSIDLAGAIFNPPHFRARTTLGWTLGGLSATAALSHTGQVEDRRTTPSRTVRGLTQADLTLRYRTGDGPAWWRGLDLVVTGQNLFNATPDPITTTLPYDAPYDSTNYAPIGRFLAIGVSKSW